MKRLFSLVFMMLTIIMPMKLWAQEPYAVLTTDTTSVLSSDSTGVTYGKTLTFYYDDQKATRGGMSVGPFTYDTARGWSSYVQDITTVVFDDTFTNCTTLTSTAFWFYGCEKLTDISGIGNLKTDNVTNMSWMFGNCSCLTSLDVSGFNTANVTDMGSMFFGCSDLTSLDLSSFNTGNVTSMQSMFLGCTGLTSLDVSNFKTYNVTNMSWMFLDCTGLTSLDLSSFNTSNVKYDANIYNYGIQSMFEGCSALTTIWVGDNWTTANLTESVDVFKDCAALVGGAGTHFDPNHVDYTYAHIDGGTSNPGYFTDKNAPAVAEPYAVISNGNTVLTFYYDDKKTERDGLSVGPFSNMLEKGWGDYMNMVIMNVVFDASFANCTTLTSTADWFSGCSYLTTITGIEYLNTDNVTNMNRMFYGCSHLTTLDISNFNTSNVTDMAEMFGGCSGLTTLNVSNFNTSNVTNMSSMFSNCSGLTSLDVSNFNTSNVTNMNSMFDNCSGLTSLDIRNFNTSNVTDMGAMFYGCSGLISLDLSNLNTDSVTVMKWMFTGCSGLSTIDLSQFNTSKVTEMSRMFEGCSSLTSLELNNFNTSTVIHMDKMFMGCSSLASLDLSHFETPLLIDVNSMFRDAAALTTIYVGDSWDMTYVSNGADMFTGCTNLVGGNGTVYDANHVDHTYAHIDGGTSNPGYFTDKNASLTIEPYVVLTTDTTSVLSSDSTGVTYGKTLTFYYDDQKEVRNGMSVGPFFGYPDDYPAWHSSAGSITQAVFDVSFANCSSITSTAYWFYECSKLSQIEGIENLKTDSVTTMGSMFESCSGLTTLDVSYFNTANVTEMWAMFKGCSSLTSLDVSHFNTQNVTSMAGMFDGCSSLTSLDVSGFSTVNVTVMNYMFSGCSGLTTLDVSHFNTENVTYISGMFFGCSSLTSLDVSNFKTDNVTDMSGMFSSCSGLTSLDVSNFKTDNVTSMSGMFSSCSGLTSLDVSNFKTDNVTNMSSMFSGCTGLTNLDVSNFNTSKVTSMFTMFYDCSGLTSLDLSSFNTANVTSMQSMFLGCSGLTSLDLSNFNTENVTNMSWMFSKCSRLTSLDLSSFNTSNVKYEFDTNNYINYSFGIRSMFEGCSALTTIWVGDNWTTANLTESVDVFNYCAALVGGAGTHFDPDHVDYTYAHIDGGVDNPGYFTRSGDAPYTEPEPYVVLSQDSTMLTFYYDDQKTANNGIGILNQINYYSGETVPWYDSREKVTTVVFDTSFANYKPTTTAMWFYNFLSLTSIMGIENLNTEEVTDMYSMFDECYYLPTIDVSHFNTGKVENMAGMFSECLSLTELDLSNFNTERVKDMSSMFSMLTMMIDDSTGTFVKSQLRSLNISSFNTSNVTDMHQMFRDCSALTSLDLTNFNTGNVTNMEWMLMGLTGLTTIDVSNFDTHNVKNMNGLFWGDSGLTTLDLKNFNTTNVTSMKSMFKGCSSLTSIELDNFNTSKVTDMSGMFASCSSLTTIYAGNEWTTASVTDGTDMFKGCSAIKGGKGTTYSETFTIAYGNSTSSDYARIDYKGMPGYFTPKYGYTPEPTYTLEGNVLTIKAPIESSVYYVITDLYSGVDFESADSLRIPETLYTGPLTLDHPVRVRFMAVNGRIAHSEIIVVKYKPIEATFDGRVLAVGGSTTMTDALESVGGRDEVAKTITAIVWNSSATLTNSDLQGLDNPNLLIYVNERSLAPQNRNNVVVNGLAMNVVLSDTGSGNCDFYAPQTFTAEMITYSREFKQATQVGVCRGWETICLPFMVQTIAHADNGVITPFGVDSSNKHFWLRQLSTNGLVSATKIEANLPYLISMPNDEKNYAKEYILKGLVTFSAQNAVVPKTEPTALALADSSVVMMPALQSVGKSSTVWALNVGQERSQYFEGSTFERDYREVRPFEAYTIHRSDTPAPRFLPINDLMNSATGIETISNVIMSHDNYYHIDGRKVDGKPTKKGLYITNGRKVVIK